MYGPTSACNRRPTAGAADADVRPTYLFPASRMPAPEPHRLLSALKATLTSQGIDIDVVVAEFGQVRASEERARGKQFTLREHVRGLVLSLLSNQRPWGPIARSLLILKWPSSVSIPSVCESAIPTTSSEPFVTCGVAIGRSESKCTLSAETSKRSTASRRPRKYGSVRH